MEVTRLKKLEMDLSEPGKCQPLESFQIPEIDYQNGLCDPQFLDAGGQDRCDVPSFLQNPSQSLIFATSVPWKLIS
jgi:hypothetical protein